MNSDDERREVILQRLKESLQALAVPASEQVRLFPEFVVKTDELVLDFDHWQYCAMANYGSQMTEAQRTSLVALDSHTDGGSSAGRSIWDEQSLFTETFWDTARRLSKSALEAFGWPLQVPPTHSSEYVRGHSAKT